MIIYQMVKVGSSSIKQSLLDYGLPCVFHAHVISPDEEDNSRFIYNHLIKQKKFSRFITLVREPIGRNISAFFENFKRETGIRFEDSTHTLEQLTGLFINKYAHTKPLDWFDKYLKPIVGIDVYQHTFPKDKGYLLLSNDYFELLILKCEMDNSKKQEYISTFLNIEGFSIANYNVGSKKVYASVYKDFKKNIQLPESYIRKMMTAKYTRHFYSEDEIKKIENRWSRAYGFQQKINDNSASREYDFQ